MWVEAARTCECEAPMNVQECTALKAERARASSNAAIWRRRGFDEMLKRTNMGAGDSQG